MPRDEVVDNQIQLLRTENLSHPEVVVDLVFCAAHRYMCLPFQYSDNESKVFVLQMILLAKSETSLSSSDTNLQYDSKITIS